MKYQISDKYEVNNVDENFIFIDSDFSNVYVADEMAYYIISHFKKAQTLEDAKKAMSKLSGFCEAEFNDFISDIIDAGIITISDG